MRSHRWLGVWVVLAVFAGAGAPAQGFPAEPPNPVLTIRVKDESGAPPAGAEALLWLGGADRGYGWRPVTDGEFVTSMSLVPLALDFRPEKARRIFTVRAPGHAPITEALQQETSGTLDFQMARGTPVEFTLVQHDGQPPPDDFLPDVHTRATGRYGRLRVSGKRSATGPFGVERVAAGRYRFHALPSQAPFFIVVDDPQVMRGLVEGPFAWEAMTTSSGVEVQMPEPRTVTVVYDPQTTDTGLPVTFHATVQAPVYRHGGLSRLVSGDESAVGRPAVAVYDRMASGRAYSFHAVCGDTASLPGNLQLDEDDATVTLKSSGVPPALRVLDGRTSAPVTTATALISYNTRNLGARHELGGSGSAGLYSSNPADGLIRIRRHAEIPAGNTWVPAEDGTTKTLSLTAWVWAEEPLSALTTASAPLPVESFTAALQPERRVVFKIRCADGQPAPPDLRAAVIPEALADYAYIVLHHRFIVQPRRAHLPPDMFPSVDRWPMVLEHVSGDTFAAAVPDGVTSGFLVVEHAGFLQNFRTAVAFTDGSDEAVSVTVPLVGALEIELDASAYLATSGTQLADISVFVQPVGPRTGTWLDQTGINSGVDSKKTVGALAPGNYSISVQARPESEDAGVNVAASTNTVATVQPATTTTVRIALPGPATPGGVKPAHTQGPGETYFEFPALRVVDPDDKPVTGAQAVVWIRYWHGGAMGQHGKENSPGRYTFGRERAWDSAVAAYVTTGVCEYRIRARGFLPEILTVQLPAATSETVVRLRRGRRVEMTVHPIPGTTLPDTLVPVVFTEPWAAEALSYAQINDCDSPEAGGRKPSFDGCSIVHVESLGGGRYAFPIDDATTQLGVVIHHPGYIQGYVPDVIRQNSLAQGRFEVGIPQPEMLTIRVRPADRIADNPGYRHSRLYMSLGIPPLFTVEKRFDGPRPTALQIQRCFDTPRFEVKLEDLAPFSGRAYCNIKVMAGALSRLPGSEQETKFHFAGGVPWNSTGTVEIVFDRPDKASLLGGDGVAQVRLLGVHGEPLSGTQWLLDARAGNMGFETVLTGTVPASGIVSLAGLVTTAAPGASEVPTYGINVVRETGPEFTGFLDRPVNGQMTTAIKEMRLPAGLGDMAPDVEMFDWVSSRTLRLSDFRGRIVVLRLWHEQSLNKGEVVRLVRDLQPASGKSLGNRIVVLVVRVDGSQTIPRGLEEATASGLVRVFLVPSQDADRTVPSASDYRALGLYDPFVPRTLLIDSSGRIQKRHDITQDTKDLTERVRQLLAVE